MTSLPWKMRTNLRSMWRLTTEPVGGPMASRRKRSNVAPRCGGTAASTVSPVGEAANRSASAPRRTAEPVGTGRPGSTGIPSLLRFGANGEVAPDSCSHRPSRAASLALWTTVEPIGGWRTGPKGEPAPKRFGAAEKANPDDLAERRSREPRCFGTEASNRAARRTLQSGVQKPSSKRMPALKCSHRRNGGLPEWLGRRRSTSPTPRRCGPSQPDALDPRSWCQGSARTDAFRRSGKSVPEYRAERQTQLPKRSGADGSAPAARQPAKRSCPPEKPAPQSFGGEEKVDSTGVHAGYARPGVLPQAG